MSRWPFRRCGLEWTILLSAVVYNLCFGPWEGSTWLEKLMSSAEEYFEKEYVAGPLFAALYQLICRGRGLPPVGTFEHREAVLKQTASAEGFSKKGAKGNLETVVHVGCSHRLPHSRMAQQALRHIVHWPATRHLQKLEGVALVGWTRCLSRQYCRIPIAAEIPQSSHTLGEGCQEGSSCIQQQQQQRPLPGGRVHTHENGR